MSSTQTSLTNQSRGNPYTAMQAKSLRLFIRKLFLFLLIPFIIFELWVIFSPINLYVFRSWEAISPYLLAFYGPFYPNQTLAMTEVGELGARTSFAIPKPVLFITDNYGYRFDSSTAPSEELAMVIVGDSMVAGSSLTQSDTIASVLSADLGQTVYPFAPSSIDKLLQDERFGQDLPSIVILEVVERNISSDICPTSLERNPSPPYFMDSSPALAQTRITLDRSLREHDYLRNYLRARLGEKVPIANENGMLFFEDSLTSPALETIPEILTALTRCQAWFAEQGAKFVFLPIPDRETIYFEDIPESHRPLGLSYAERSQFLRQLIAEANRNNLAILDTLTAYETARDAGMNPYHLDDTHWNATGVRIAADLFLDWLN